MYLQHEYIRENVGLTASATYKVELPEQGVLSSLLMRFYAKELANTPFGALYKWRPIDYIDQIDVIANGATIIKSITGKQAQFLSFCDQKVMPPHKWEEYSESTSREHILINFGRMFADKDLGLDLSKFDSVELHIKSTWTAAMYSSMTISVLATYMRDPAIAPIGYVRSEQWRKWTTVISETKYLDLPTEFPIRRIVLQAIPEVAESVKEEDTSLHNLMSDIDLSLKSGVLRVYKGGLDDLMWLNVFELGVIPQTRGVTYHDADYGFDTGIGYVETFLGGGGSKSGAALGAIPSPTGAINGRIQCFETFTGDEVNEWIATGAGYHGCAVVRFDHEPNPLYWLDPEAQKQVLLNITTGSGAQHGGGENIVVLDRLVRY